MEKTQLPTKAQPKIRNIVEDYVKKFHLVKVRSKERIKLDNIFNFDKMSVMRADTETTPMQKQIQKLDTSKSLTKKMRPKMMTMHSTLISGLPIFKSVVSMDIKDVGLLFNV